MYSRTCSNSAQFRGYDVKTKREDGFRHSPLRVPATLAPMYILSSTLVNFEMVQILMSSRVDEIEFPLRRRAVISSQLSSTLMQLLFSFDRDMRVEK
jgi:hypothetical protein